METIFKINSLLAAVIVSSVIFATSSCGVAEQEAEFYTLQNNNNMSVKVTDFGARIVSICVPSADGSIKDVVWGYDTVEEYFNSTDKYCGPIVGRFGNRIGKGKFSIDSTEYTLTINDGENHLHGGTGGFSTKIWQANVLGPGQVEMSYLSKDGEEGYPGNLKVSVTYTLTDDNSLKISYKATTDAPTIVNLTSHAYFNLHGTSRSSINSHILTINADNYTPTDKGLIPTGEIASVEGTPLDFRTPTAIGERINTTDFEPISFAGGYDHNWVLNRDGLGNGDIAPAAEVYEPATGIVMRVLTDQPGLQFYSGNFMDGKDKGRNGDVHNYRTGIALEAQNFPDAPNHGNFPSAVLLPGEEYIHNTIYSFSIR